MAIPDRRVVTAVLAAAGVCAWLAWRLWPRDEAARGAAAAGGDRGVVGGAAGGEGAAGGAVVPERPGAAVPSRVTRLSRDERRRLGEQIAVARMRARARARAESGVPGDRDNADVVISLERAGKPLQDALQESIKLLAECYEAQPDGAGRTAAALMTMISDPDFGTVIDTEEITDADGRPLPAALDECLRDRIDTLALPPLGEGGKLPLKYTFNFDDEEPR